jgi:TetR/AcrR family transcriptional repressor of nem operon
MPRVSREQTDSNRLAITDASARLFRERGLKGVSVADLMAAAGLTHGGFYGHFESKDALAAEAVAKAFEQSGARWKKRMAGKAGPREAMSALVEGYLSAQARNSPGTSCPTAALAGDVAREPADAPVRAAYRAGVDGMLRVLSSLQQTGDADVDREQALVELSTMVGALVLARATAGSDLSDELLNAAREHLVPALAPTPPRRKSSRRASA